MTALNGVDIDSESGEDTSTSHVSTKGSSSRRLEHAVAAGNTVDNNRNRGRVLQDQGSNSSASTERVRQILVLNYCVSLT